MSGGAPNAPLSQQKRRPAADAVVISALVNRDLVERIDQLGAGSGLSRTALVKLALNRLAEAGL